MRLFLLLLTGLFTHTALANPVSGDHKPEVVNTYRLTNKASGFQLYAAGGAQRLGDYGLLHWPAGEVQPQDQAALNWVFLPVPGEHRTYWIVSEVNGLVLLADWAGTRPDKRRAHLFPMNGDGLQSKKGAYWRVEAEGDFARIINVESGFALMPEFAGTRPDKRGMHHWPLEDRGVQSQDGFLWRLERIGSHTIPPLPPARVMNQQPPVMQGHFRPERADAGVVAEYWVPCAEVQDPGKSILWKIKNSPYYKVQRRAAWEPAEFFQNTANMPVKQTWTIKKGWSESVRKSFASTVGASASATVFGIGLSASFSITTGRESQSGRTGERIDSREMSVPPNTSVTLWARVDTLSIRRMDGSAFTSKTWVSDGLQPVMGAYPPQAP